MPKDQKKRDSYPTKDEYEQLKVAFEQAPGNASHAAKVTGLPRRMCARAWTRGWSDERSDPRLTWCRPIEVVFLEEKAAVRRQLQEDARRKSTLDEETYKAQVAEDLRMAKQDILASRALRGKTTRAARNAAAGLLAVSNRLSRAAVPLANSLEAAISSGHEFTPKEAASLLKDISTIVRIATSNVKEVDDIERQALGEPDLYVHTSDSMMTEAQALHEIEEASKAAARARKRGTLSVIDAEVVPNDDLKNTSN